MKSHFMAAPSSEELGVVGNRTETKADEQESSALPVTKRPPLTPEQEARLAVVMARDDGGHLTDGRHLAEMPNYRPTAGSIPSERTLFARGYCVN